MGTKFKAGDLVWMRIGERPPVRIRVLGVADNGLYLLDWSSCGFNALLNTVRISGRRLSLEP
jgi:hypothetical protein